MTHDPVRLLNDPAIGAALRRDLGSVARVDVGYDVAAGLARFEGNLAAGTGVAKSAGASGGAIAGAALLLAGGLTAALLLWPGQAPTPATIASGNGSIASAPLMTPVVPMAPALAPVDPVEHATVIQLEDPPSHGKSSKRPVRPRPSEADPADQTVSPPAATPTDALREARNLQAARSQLGRDASRALALAEAGAAEFTGGTFTQEWEGVAILALFELGRPEARTRGEAFLRTYPSGTYAQRVRQALEN